jgi:hypothetical protein
LEDFRRARLVFVGLSDTVTGPPLYTVMAAGLGHSVVARDAHPPAKAGRHGPSPPAGGPPAAGTYPAASTASNSFAMLTDRAAASRSMFSRLKFRVPRSTSLR